jgi:DNA-directed RNA polymerase subunit alpha
MSDYDRLIFEILTDGTIEPDDALAEAAQILVDHGRVFAEFNRRGREAAAPVGSFISDEVQNKPLADLGLSPRVLNALRSRQIERVGQILTMDPDQLLSIRNFGPRSMTELRQKLAEFGYLPEGEEIALSADLLLPAGDGVEGDLDDFGGFDNGDDVAAAIASLGGDGGAPDELGLNVRDEQE